LGGNNSKELALISNVLPDKEFVKLYIEKMDFKVVEI